MANYTIVSRDRHAGKAWRRPLNYSFAASQSIVPIVAAEFSSASLAMPVAFVQQAAGYVPVAILSPLPERNLFVGPDGEWPGIYVPAALRCYPFRLVRAEGAEELAVCIDEDSGLIVPSNGRAGDFFDAEGNLGPETKAM